MNKNKIPQGYKNSPLGIIPENWEVNTLGKIGNFKRGKGVPKNKIIDDGHKCLTYGDIYTKYDTIMKDVKSFIDDEVAKVSQEINKGDTLFASSGETLIDIGKTVVYLDHDKAYAGGDIIIYQQSSLHSLWLAYVLNSNFANAQKYKMGQGYSVVHIYSSQLEKLKIPFPPFSEQQKIAEILSCWDEAIEKQSQFIEKLEIRKRGLMQQLLTGKKRIKGFENEWKKIELGSVATINRGGSPRPIEKFITSKETGINWIKIGDVDEGAKFIERTKEKIIEEGVLKSRQVFKGDFLLSNSMSFGRPYILKIDGCIHDGWLVIQDYSNAFNIDYLFYVLGFETTLSQYKSLAAGSGVLNLNKEKVKMVVLFHPSIEEQTAIANILSIADDEIQKEMELLTALRSQKKGLMQQLLTGKKRVKI